MKISSMLFLIVATAYADVTRRRRYYDAPGAACTAANFGSVCNQGTRRRMGPQQQCCAATNTQTTAVKTGNCVVDCTFATSLYDEPVSQSNTQVGVANARPYQLCQEVNNSTGDSLTNTSPRTQHKSLLGTRPGRGTCRAHQGPSGPGLASKQPQRRVEA